MRSRSGQKYTFTIEQNPLEYEEKKKCISSAIPSYAALIFIGFLLCLYGLVVWVDDQLPVALNIADEAKFPDKFITERAKDNLKYLTNLGPRVVGSHENEVLTVEFLKKKINEIIVNADESKKIELDVQTVSGSYLLGSKPAKVNIYANVQNVVVKLHGKIANYSLLLNSHFDSVPTSPGGSDDGINVVAMLEILQKLSKQKTEFLYSIIFLFNGAEETCLQASHGFVTKHKWAKECKVVINLEAAGAGGKITMFQTGPDRPWLNEEFGKVPHPVGLVAAEELFQANVIPSDTDFRIFRDYGAMVGIDMAFEKDGYRYHTKFDGFDNIPLGSYQLLGDNLLSLVKNIANNPKLTDLDHETGLVVFFDIFGGFFISYTTQTALILNILISILSVLVLCISLQRFRLGLSISTVFYLVQVIAVILFGWISSLIFVIFIGFALDFIGFSMSWYGNPWLVFGIFSIPIVLTSTPMMLLVRPKNISNDVNCFIQSQVLRCIWTCVMLNATLLGIRSSYSLSLIVLFNSLASGIILLFRKENLTAWWKIIYILINLIPSLHVMQISITIEGFLISMTGRIGSDKNPDIMIGFITYVFTMLIITPFNSFIVCVKKPSNFYKVLVGVFLVCIFMVFTPLGFPYSGDPKSPTPQRFWILHSQRVFHGEDGGVIKTDSGYFFLNMDRNSPKSVRKYVDELRRSKDIQDDCENFLLCGLPLAHPKMSEVVKYSTWIPASVPVINEPVELKINEKIQLSTNIQRYNLTIHGPDHLMFYISPKTNLKLISTNLAEKLPEDNSTWNNRPYYFFVYNWGKENTPLSVILNIELPENHTGPCMDFAISGNYVHPKTMRITPDFQKFLSKFPDWADLTTSVASYKSWII